MVKHKWDKKTGGGKLPPPTIPVSQIIPVGLLFSSAQFCFT